MPVTRQTLLTSHPRRIRIFWPWRTLIPLHLLFLCVSFPVLPFLLVFAMHRPRNSFGSFSPLSLCLLLWPLIISFLLYDSLLVSALITTFTCLHFHQLLLCLNVDISPLQITNVLSSFSSHFCLIVPAFLLRFLILFSQHDLIGHILIIHHPFHRSLNGISPTTISPCSHSSFPSPLSLSR